MTNTTTNNPQMRAGFTMIELIFVIVIIGILASVAIPKLAATRDDAKISKMANAIQTAKSELAARIIATNNVPNDGANAAARVKLIKDYSNTIAEAVISNDANVTNQDVNTSTVTFIDKDSTTACKDLIIHGNKSTSNVFIEIKSKGNGSTSSICNGVDNLVPDTNITIGGTQVTY